MAAVHDRVVAIFGWGLSTSCLLNPETHIGGVDGLVLLLVLGFVEVEGAMLLPSVRPRHLV